jgi:hypothetical protein
MSEGIWAWKERKIKQFTVNDFDHPVGLGRKFTF